MFQILIDTSVWLDLAKDYRNQPVISSLDDVLKDGNVALIVPEAVLEEFERNKDRVAQDASRRLQAHFSLVRDAVRRFGDDNTINATVKALDEVDHAAVFKGEAVHHSIARIEQMLQASQPIPATDVIKAKAADRATAKAAPFHRGKNSIGDALIIETYADHLSMPEHGETDFAFVTHNKADFSLEGGDHRQPHADFADLFDGNRSRYWVSLVDLLNDFDQDLLANYDMELYGVSEVRGLTEILEAEHMLFRQVWYNRHQNLRISIERGRTRVVTNEEWQAAKPKQRQKMITEGTWKGAREAAKRTEGEVGIDNLGPWDDFKWGMLNGKLSALRWVLGDEWAMLDT